MTQTIIERLHYYVNIHRMPLVDAVEQVVPGADPTYWQRRLANYDPTAPARKRKPAQCKPSGNIGKRKRINRFTLESSQNWALVETVKRVNEGDSDDS